MLFVGSYFLHVLIDSKYCKDMFFFLRNSLKSGGAIKNLGAVTAVGNRNYAAKPAAANLPTGQVY